MFILSLVSNEWPADLSFCLVYSLHSRIIRYPWWSMLIFSEIIDGLWEKPVWSDANLWRHDGSVVSSFYWFAYKYLFVVQVTMISQGFLKLCSNFCEMSCNANWFKCICSLKNDQCLFSRVCQSSAPGDFSVSGSFCLCCNYLTSSILMITRMFPLPALRSWVCCGESQCFLSVHDCLVSVPSAWAGRTPFLQQLSHRKHLWFFCLPNNIYLY